jgi:hypothetical protein
MRNLLSIFMILAILGSCKKEAEPPQISVLNLSSADIQKEEGAYLEFAYSFSAEDGLNQFRVQVIDDFVDARLQSAPWNYERDYSISGLSVEDTLKIILPYPDIEPGRYKLTVTVQDTGEQETALSRSFNVIE